MPASPPVRQPTAYTNAGADIVDSGELAFISMSDSLMFALNDYRIAFQNNFFLKFLYSLYVEMFLIKKS